MTHYVSCQTETLVNAVDAVMACVPRPWTPVMLDEALYCVMSLADQWRHDPVHPIESDDVLDDFLQTRVEEGALITGPENKHAQFPLEELTA